MFVEPVKVVAFIQDCLGRSWKGPQNAVRYEKVKAISGTASQIEELQKCSWLAMTELMGIRGVPWNVIQIDA